MATTTPAAPRKRAKSSAKVVQMDGKTEPTAQIPADFTPDSKPETVPVAPVADRTNPKPFPLPPKPSLKGGYCDAEIGMAYWRGIPLDLRERLTVYVNREHPVLNRLQECSEEDIELMRQHKKRYPIKYIDLPPEPFGMEADMEFLNRYGSGWYKVYVNDIGIKGSKDPDLQSRNLCKFIYKVRDSDFPPILDPSRPDKGLGILDWTHPDNQSYVAELRTRGIYAPSEIGVDMAESTVVGKLIDKMSDLSDRVGVHETDRLVERIAERVGGNGGSSRAGEMLDTIKAVKEMMPQPAAAAPTPPAAVDPFDTVSKIMAMRGNDPMVAMLVQRMESMDKAAEAGRQREYELQKELRQVMQQNTSQQQAAAAPKSLVDQLKELGEAKGILQTVLGVSSDPAVAAIRSGKMGWLDFASEVLPRIMEAPVMTALGNRIMASTSPVNNPAAPPPATGAVDEDMLFVQHVVTPALLEFYQTENTGAAFAQHIHDGYPTRLLGLQAYGEKTIFDLYKSRAPRPDWAILTARGEPAFALFIHEFVTWKPEAETDEPEVLDNNNGIIDLDPDDKEPSGS